MSKKVKVIIIILAVVLFVGIAYYTVYAEGYFNEGYRKAHIEGALSINLPQSVQVIKYKRGYTFIAAKMIVSKESLDELSKELKAENYSDSEALEALGVEKDYENDGILLDDTANWWHFEGSQITEHYHGLGAGKEYIGGRTAMDSVRDIYIVKNDKNTFNVYLLIRF